MPVPQPVLFRGKDLLNAANQAAQFHNMRSQANVAAEEAKLARTEQEAAAAEVSNKRRAEAYEFAANLLAGAENQQDLDFARQMFSTRYPEMSEATQGIEQLMPVYDPRKVDMISKSLLTQSERLKQEAPMQVGVGTELVDPETMETVRGATPAQTKPEYEVFTGPGGDQAYIKKGDPIPPGYSKTYAPRATSSTTINVDTGAKHQVGKASATKLEQEIMEGIRNVMSFRETAKDFKPEYVTVMGKGEKQLARVMDKAGISTEDQKEMLKERSEWYRRAKGDFIKYRKWATGVAGGEQEMKEIATSFPDPDRNSPTEYIGNLESIDDTTKQILSMNREFLKSGIDLNQPLDKVLEEIADRDVDVELPPTAKVDVKGGGGSGGDDTVLYFDAEGNLVEGD